MARATAKAGTKTRVAAKPSTQPARKTASKLALTSGAKAPHGAADVDRYIAGFPPDVARRLRAIRSAIAKAVPKAEQQISYAIMAFKLDGPLIYVAAFKAHIGLYPMTAGVKAQFKSELAGFAQSTGGVRLPLSQPVPLALIARIAKFRAGENATRAAAKRKPLTRTPTAKRR